MVEVNTEVTELPGCLVSHRRSEQVDGQDGSQVLDDFDPHTSPRLRTADAEEEDYFGCTEDLTHDFGAGTLDDAETRKFVQLLKAHAFTEENFAYTEHFIHDFDGLSTAGATDGSMKDNDDLSPNQEVEAKNASTTSNAVKNRKLHTNLAQQIASRALLLFVCFAYLAIAVMTIDIGLSAISKHMQSRLAKAEVQLEAAIDERYREKVLYHRFDIITSTPLSRGFMETYEECLARGLQRVDFQLAVLGWTEYANIRNQTIEWTTENCNRLFYTPQIMKPNTQQAISMYLVNIRHRSRQVLVRALEFMKQKKNLILNWYHGVGYIDAVPAAKDGKNSNARNPCQSQTKMPFGFSLQCDAGVPYRLVYSSSSCSERVEKVGNMVSQANDDQCSDKKRTSEKAATRARRKAADLTFICTKVRQAMDMNAELLYTFAKCEFFWIFVYLLAALSTLCGQFCNPVAEPARFNICKVYSQAPKEAKYAIGTIIIQFCALLSYAVVDRFSCDECHLACLFGIALVASGISQLINFFFPIEQVEHIFQMSKLVKEIYQTIRSQDFTKKLDADGELEPAEPEVTIDDPAEQALPTTPAIPDAICASTHRIYEYSLQSLTDSTIAIYDESDTEGEYTDDEQDTDEEDVHSETFDNFTDGTTLTVGEETSIWTIVHA